MIMKTPITPTSDIPLQAFGTTHTESGKIKQNRIRNLATGDDRVVLSEPVTAASGEYPYIQANVTAGGHVKEYDDTHGAERIFEMHKSGTFYEIHPDGSKVTKVFGDDWEICIDDKNIVVGGTRNVVVQGDATLLVKGDCVTKVDGNYRLTVNGDMTTRVRGKTTHFSQGDMNLQTQSNFTTYAGINTTLSSIGDIQLQTNGGLTTMSDGGTVMYAGGVFYIDGDAVRINEPHGRPSRVSVPKQDPTAGLIIPDSLCEPSFDQMRVFATMNDELMPIVDDTVTYPRNRTPNI